MQNTKETKHPGTSTHTYLQWRTSDKVLDLAANHYVIKPFGLLELFTLIKTLFRRSRPRKASEPLQKNEIIYKNIVIDIDKRKASVKDKRLDLSSKEF